MRISDWSSDVCSSDLVLRHLRLSPTWDRPALRCDREQEHTVRQRNGRCRARDRPAYRPLFRRHQALCRCARYQRRGTPRNLRRQYTDSLPAPRRNPQGVRTVTDLHEYLAEFEDIPGNRVYNATRARKGYHLNTYAVSLLKDRT